ncbi:MULTISPECIES: YajG family lipoprotein [Acidiphilium]|uniref:Uncharacterized protein n=2 Tax=Acidiphilium TaxID=522 RepID=F0J462_ACIMA|nr:MULTISPECIES: hypothetical protein [Acidiphilium]MBU6357158.1 hypothetical protein [Rhodospirillales bacterium]KDM67187.1 hypothetical protein ACIDI_42c00080 [Acidiphilium sp. JA12-A1]MBS3023004.1 hypothetical protein [Acidiphilium multivorum]MDE2327456.1 hypothetical protein [Rhodospirillales bacterium]UNC14160.1 hypothetical protein FE249_08040 [Acidiphilium multivorum]
MTARGLMLAVVLLAGCAAPPPQVVTRIRVVEPRIPPSLLACPPAPAVPLVQRQSQVATYVAELWEAGEICRNHLAAVAGALRPHPVPPVVTHQSLVRKVLR